MLLSLAAAVAKIVKNIDSNHGTTGTFRPKVVIQNGAHFEIFPENSALAHEQPRRSMQDARSRRTRATLLGRLLLKNICSAPTLSLHSSSQQHTHGRRSLPINYTQARVFSKKVQPRSTGKRVSGVCSCVRCDSCCCCCVEMRDAFVCRLLFVFFSLLSENIRIDYISFNTKTVLIIFAFIDVLL